MQKVIECRGQSFCVGEKDMSCNLDMAVFIDKNRYVWGLGEDLAIAMVESYEGNIETIMIPGTDFIMIFDEANTVVLAGHKYLFYDCLIMKSTEMHLRSRQGVTRSDLLSSWLIESHERRLILG